ncbi:MAG: histidinol dehydrogenase [Blastocatellia bacterium]|nr:histidinol dehydrogenase [Blastocatellia bacterium]MCS7157561.1 histidinol dehydrogenase [Blastocatellia bacterium]MCX7753513.1 histidinol dehydrogenase [Blastocatellia bacterium]MDW8166929.1 histidinol dehydrogenase [Acidobacteriota bacterium]MDW8257506.1 histidinol dehydrogenase [Acidobacteriota bacterium]
MSKKWLIPIRALTQRTFERRLREIRERRGLSKAVWEQVHRILEDVRRRGDEALLEYVARFDGVVLSRDRLRVEPEAVRAAYGEVSREAIAALRLVRRRLERAERRWLEALKRVRVVADGVVIESAHCPIRSVGCYVPGGKAAYPSSVLMNVVPARLAGVERIVICSPPRQETGEIHPLVLVAADLCGITEIYRVGGATAIAALAYGTATIPSVEKIVGPGGPYVVAAKLLAAERVGIDLPAGPSELVIVADETASPQAIAADLVAQAEHGEDSLCGLLATSRHLAQETARALRARLTTAERRAIIQQALARRGFLLYAEGDLDLLVRFANALAPEHVQVMTRRPRSVARGISRAGLVLIGSHSPASASDYVLGTNHVLPTGGTAAAYSGLSVLDFLKRVTYAECARRSLAQFVEPVRILALAEGLPNHYRALEERVRGLDHRMKR